MTKLQGRTYFLYPILLGITHYFFNILVPVFYSKIPLGQDNVFLFFYILIFSGLIAFSMEKKNTLAQIFSIAGSTIIFSFPLLLSLKLEFVFLSMVRVIAFSLVVHALCFVFYLLLFHVFEWMFSDKK